MIKKILFASANPSDTRKLNLDKEVRDIQIALKSSKNRDDFEIVTCLAVRVEDLRRALLDEQPNIVHFSGHGDTSGLRLEDDNGLTQVVSELALASLFENFSRQVECVVLNACYSKVQAEAIYKHVDCVIGMNQPVRDNSAINFAIEFYDAVFSGESYDYAFNIACSSMQLEGSKEHSTPEILFRPAKSTEKNNTSQEKTQSQFGEICESVGGAMCGGMQAAQGNSNNFWTNNNSFRLCSVDAANDDIYTQFAGYVNKAEQQNNLAKVTCSSENTNKDKPILYPLWFGTNRRPNNPENLSQGFSGERAEQIYYGTCEVLVPKSHKIGSTGSPLWQRILTLTDDRLKLKQESLKSFHENDFWNEVRQTLLQKIKPDERSALVFIHGYNVSFEEAALRAAQIGVDLDFQGIMTFYSWPSKGEVAGYTADEATIQASEKYITKFLLNLAQNSGAKKIHIIAHSMGNRGLLGAMQRILTTVQAESQVLFGQIFLAAPDVDPDIFQELAAAYQKLAERTTLYVSRKDKALLASGIIHSHPRVGFFPPITVVNGIDTIEVSNIDLTSLGHGYFAEARSLLQDIHTLLTHDTSPEQRFGLQIQQDNGLNYWAIRQ
ncbi:hypothetical protein NIES2101_13255 [Calothrix sp. HK-06]|nr:hypothetical protein NIES2101_13255 [Calothrix sp. HK-06]